MATEINVLCVCVCVCVCSLQDLGAPFTVFPCNLSCLSHIHESAHYPYSAIFSTIFLLILGEEDIFLFSEYCILVHVITVSYSMRTGLYFLGVKRLSYATNRSVSSNIEVKNEWSYISTPSDVFMACKEIALH